MPHMDAFEEDREAVLADLARGEFDYLEVATRVTEARFFRFLLEQGDLKGLARCYPTPRKKEEVPLWLYLASQLTLRLHGQHAYGTLPYILHAGGLRDALGAGQVEVTVLDQPERKRLVVNLVNMQDRLPVLPVFDLKVRIRLDGRKIRDVRLAPDSGPLPWKTEDGHTTIAVPKLEVFQMILVAYA